MSEYRQRVASNFSPDMADYSSTQREFCADLIDEYAAHIDQKIARGTFFYLLDEHQLEGFDVIEIAFRKWANRVHISMDQSYWHSL